MTSTTDSPQRLLGARLRTVLAASLLLPLATAAHAAEAQVEEAGPLCPRRDRGSATRRHGPAG